MSTEARGVVILPMHNELASAQQLLPQIRDALIGVEGAWRILVVDDGSSDGTGDFVRDAEGLGDREVLQLAMSRGHQAAIYSGMRQALMGPEPPDWLVVMDGDGEDDPEAIPRLWAERQKNGVVFARRGKRTDRPVFKIGWWFYRLLYWAVTGHQMRHGNFALLHAETARALINEGFVHFAAALDRMKLPRVEVVVDRRPRIAGQPKMNVNRLVHHGLQSLVEQSEAMVHTMFRLLLVVLGLGVACGAYILYAKFSLHSAIPGWASTLAVGLINAGLISMVGFILGLTALNFQARKRLRDLPDDGKRL